MTGPVVVIGDALLDRDINGDVLRIAPDAPVPVLQEQLVTTRPGGGALAAALAARTGAETILITALGLDSAAEELRVLLAACGVAIVDLTTSGATVEKIRLRAGDHSLLRLDRGEPHGVIGAAPPLVRHLLGAAGAILVADYGRGIAAHAELRELAGRASAPLVWDPHPRGAPLWPGALLVTPNAAEIGVAESAPLRRQVDEAASALARWQAHGVAVTLGSAGALYLSGDGPPLMVRAQTVVTATDTCGAGDCFAAAAAAALASGALPSEAVTLAVKSATQFVAAGGANGFTGSAALSVRTPEQPDRSVEGVLEAVRAAKGTIVATGGCFDLLHAGHVAHLEAARRLGDCLIVCMNSDSSVRALKGADRPLVGEGDRRRVLEALECVDAVVIFDEPTPARVLGGIRPSIFAKGGDYGGSRLVEQDALDAWGGQCVVLPFHEGYSTSRLLAEARRR
jgi:D-beta-D-heptose 7-phosphate kinase / D-beta-D-heptose 1-phosphate adenosyltransferase